jgi:sulfofructose kinase
MPGDTPRILCVGMVTWDRCLRVDDIPFPDTKGRVRSWVEMPGGPATNAAIQAARLGAEVGLVGRLGNDETGERIAGSLRREKVDTALLAWSAEPTPEAVILVPQDGRRAVLAGPAPASGFPRPDVATLTRPGWDLMLVDGHPDPALALAWVKEARAAGIPTLLDAGSWRAGMDALLAATDHGVASMACARSAGWSGGPDPDPYGHFGTGHGLRAITVGEKGAWLWVPEEERFAHQPGFRIRPVDTTGAGDALHGAIAWSLARGDSNSSALHQGQTAGALACRDLGHRAFPFAKELKAPGDPS